MASPLEDYTCLALIMFASSSSLSTKSQPCNCRNYYGHPQAVPNPQSCETFCALFFVSARGQCVSLSGSLTLASALQACGGLRLYVQHVCQRACSYCIHLATLRIASRPFSCWWRPVLWPEHSKIKYPHATYYKLRYVTCLAAKACTTPAPVRLS